MSNTTALLALRLVSAKAAKLADDLERNRLWDGDLARGVSELRAAIEDAARAADQGSRG